MILYWNTADFLSVRSRASHFFQRSETAFMFQSWVTLGERNGQSRKSRGFVATPNLVNFLSKELKTDLWVIQGTIWLPLNVLCIVHLLLRWVSWRVRKLNWRQLPNGLSYRLTDKDGPTKMWKKESEEKMSMKNTIPTWYLKFLCYGTVFITPPPGFWVTV